MRLSIPSPLGRFRGGLLCLYLLSQLYQLFRRCGGIVSSLAVENNGFHHLLQFWFDVLVAHGHGRVHDAHVQSCLHRVVQEHRVHCLAYGVVASEGEREVAYAAAEVHFRHLLAYGAASLYEGTCVVVVFRHSRCHCQHVRVEDNVLCWETYALHQSVGSACHRHLAFVCVSLPFFVKQHHHRCGSHGMDEPCLFDEFLLALLQRYGVHYALALYALQSSFQYIPFR